MFNVTTVLPHSLLQTNPSIRHNFSTQLFDTILQKARGTTSQCGLQRRPEKARKCSAAQGPHSEAVLRAFWRLVSKNCVEKLCRKVVSKSCDECKGSFARGCEAKRWSHWTCSALGTIFQPMKINSVPDVKCFCNNKNVLCAQSMVWHFVHNPVSVNMLAHLQEECSFDQTIFKHKAVRDV